jgi:hypothetical protein
VYVDCASFCRAEYVMGAGCFELHFAKYVIDVLLLVQSKDHECAISVFYIPQKIVSTSNIYPFGFLVPRIDPRCNGFWTERNYEPTAFSAMYVGNKHRAENWEMTHSNVLVCIFRHTKHKI